MIINAIIEKGTDGEYSVRSEQHLGNYYFGGYGRDVREAKADFSRSIEEAKLALDTTEEIKVSYKYDLPSFFADFDYINVSRFAQYAGINESKMRQYKCGSSYPCERTTRKILNAINEIATNLLSVNL